MTWTEDLLFTASRRGARREDLPVIIPGRETLSYPAMELMVGIDHTSASRVTGVVASRLVAPEHDLRFLCSPQNISTLVRAADEARVMVSRPARQCRSWAFSENHPENGNLIAGIDQGCGAGLSEGETVTRTRRHSLRTASSLSCDASAPAHIARTVASLTRNFFCQHGVLCTLSAAALRSLLNGTESFDTPFRELPAIIRHASWQSLPVQDSAVTDGGAV